MVITKLIPYMYLKYRWPFLTYPEREREREKEASLAKEKEATEQGKTWTHN